MECKRCLYNDSQPGIVIGEDGTCNYCKIHDDFEKEYPVSNELLEREYAKIRASGVGKKYDCVIGISGGCDSSFLLHSIVENGIRPLCVTFNDGWNAPVADSNIKKVTSKLDVVEYKVDRKEFYDMCRSMFFASVPEIEAPADVAIHGALYRAAVRHNIKNILIGHSFRTEGISPIGWFYFDDKYVRSIHNTFGKVKRSTYPGMPLMKQLKWALSGINRPRLIYYMDYNKEKAKKLLSDKYGWEWYGSHHGENYHTIFSNRIYMPLKFNIDVRYIEYGALVRSGMMTKADAVYKMKKLVDIPCGIIDLVRVNYGITHAEYLNIMNMPNKSAKDYPTYIPIFKRFRPLFWIMYKSGLLPKSFYVKYCCGGKI